MVTTRRKLETGFIYRPPTTSKRPVSLPPTYLVRTVGLYKERLHAFSKSNFLLKAVKWNQPLNTKEKNQVPTSHETSCACITNTKPFKYWKKISSVYIRTQEHVLTYCTCKTPWFLRYSTLHAPYYYRCCVTLSVQWLPGLYASTSLILKTSPSFQLDCVYVFCTTIKINVNYVIQL